MIKKSLLLVFLTVLLFAWQNVKADENPANFYVSSDSVYQGDTILVVVKNEPNEITGSLGKINLHFFRNESGNDWVAIVGIYLKKKPGKYDLLIYKNGGVVFKKEITVHKRTFPIKPFIITPELKEKGYTFKKIISTIENEEEKKLRETLDAVNPFSYFSKPFIYPLSTIKITGLFGDIRKSKNYKIQHLGVDLQAPVGTPIMAANDGKIVFEDTLPDYGKILIIDHGFGVYSLYLHLSDFKVANGQMIKQGDIVALSGDTGYAIGPHLHFSIKVRGATLDPLRFIQATQVQW